MIKLCFLDYLPRGGARRAPELQHVTKDVVGELEHADNEWVGGVLRSAPEHQTPQPQHVLARLSSIRGPRATGRADVVDEFRTSGPVYSICPATGVDIAVQTLDPFFGRPTSLGFKFCFHMLVSAPGACSYPLA